MITLAQSLAAWGTDGFKAQFKQEVEQLAADQLPLQQGLSLSSYVSAEPFKVMVISEQEDEAMIKVKAGIFYSGIIAGCSCSDDPSPTDVQAEYCDLQFVIDRRSAQTTVTLLAS
jgi:hypothetical protein